MNEYGYRNSYEFLIRFCERKGFSYRISPHNDNPKLDRLFVATEVGLWKIVPREEQDGFILYHHNCLKGLDAIDHPLVKPKGGNFYHKQHDAMKPFKALSGVLEYIERHDNSRMIENTGIEKMPTKTKKQRKWKRDAEKRKRKQSIKNVMDILNSEEFKRTTYR